MIVEHLGLERALKREIGNGPSAARIQAICSEVALEPCCFGARSTVVSPPTCLTPSCTLSQSTHANCYVTVLSAAHAIAHNFVNLAHVRNVGDGTEVSL